MRLIPKNTKVQIEIFKGINLWDILVMAIELGILALLVSANMPGKMIFIGIHITLSILLIYKFDQESNYIYLLNIAKHFAFGRKFDRLEKDEDLLKYAESGKENVAFDELFPDGNAEKKTEEKKNWGLVEDMSSFTGIEDGYIDFSAGYYGAAIEIPSIEFRFFSEDRRRNSIENGVGSILRSIKNDYSVNILKIERPVDYSSYVDGIYRRINSLKKSFEQGMLNDEELKSRLAILYNRLENLKMYEGDRKIVIPFYYIVLFDKDKKQLESSVSAAIKSLKNGEMNPKRLNDKELALLLKYSNALDFDASEIDKLNPEDYAKWAMPDSVEFTPRTTVVNGMLTHNFRVISYPLLVGDSWLASVMSYPSTKVMVKVKTMDSSKVIRAIDKSLSELRGVAYNAKSDSKALEAQQHIETLQNLLVTLQSDNEVLLNVNIYISAYDLDATIEDPKLPELTETSFRYRVNGMKKIVKRTWSEAGFKLNAMEFNQLVAYMGGQISGLDPMESKGRGIPSNTISACFPWIFPNIMDEDGVYLGDSEGIPVFLDFFARGKDRVNSNMVVVGKSGAGKSYAMKTLLTNLASEDCKIFILDPEDEYTDLAHNLNGKFINVATNQYGIINPFHIIAPLDDEEGAASSGYSTHLQFLEEFFRQVLPECDHDSLEYLNSLVDRVYKKHGIDQNTDISRLKPEDYPIFDDLYDEVLLEFQRSNVEWIRTMLRTLMNYIVKFADGGRYSILWNGPSTIETKENFTVFNFQSLLANRNTTVANAQMLLILKYLDNEIIKNRDYNEKYGLNRKIVIVIDEAHVFIDTKYPVALDFMYQLAKRIRKYNGMQIVITQNIKDFVGSAEIARKSAAIINACQYSFIFSLAPNDMADLCTLYEKGGGINENEQEQIIQAPRGRAFTVLGPSSRISFNITASKDISKMFKRDYVNPYYAGDAGEKYWLEDMGSSIEARKENIAARASVDEFMGGFESFSGASIVLDEIADSDYESVIPEIAEFESEADPKPDADFAAMQPQSQVVTIGTEKTDEILESLVGKLGEISMALKGMNTESAASRTYPVRAAEETTAPLFSSSEESAPLFRNTDESSGSSFRTVDDALSDIRGPEEYSSLSGEESEYDEEVSVSGDKLPGSGLFSIFNVTGSSFEFNSDEADNMDEDDENEEPDYISGDEESEIAQFSIMDYLKANSENIAADLEESSKNVDTSEFERFMNGSSFEKQMTISLEILTAYNRNHFEEA